MEKNMCPILNVLFLCYLTSVQCKQQEDDKVVGSTWTNQVLESQEEKNIKDREAPPHQEAFKAAMVHYKREDYQKAIKDLEIALDRYYRADRECRMQCDGPQAFKGYNPIRHGTTLMEIVADHYSQILHCKHVCVGDLATWPGHSSPIEDYLPLHYDYLQFSYFKVGRVREALESALTYLLFHPGEKVMMDNTAYYRAVLGQDADPHEEADWYLRRHRAEHQLLLFASEHQGVQIKPVSYRSQPQEKEDAKRAPPGSDGSPEDIIISGKANTTSDVGNKVREGGPLLYDHIQLIRDSQGLNGTQRVLLDQVISEEECAELKAVANVVNTAGDGYHGQTSPHTPNEKFEGATVLRALQFGYEGKILLKSARLFYEVSEKVRKIIESYFMLSSILHFSFTHLVCRTALAGRQEDRSDLSHPVHADNCLINFKTSECSRTSPAYTYRDYSALLYLNEDFEGGEFIFTEKDGKTLTASVKPRCGRMVGFSSGGENPHGVQAVTRGQRCAVGMWFTLDPQHQELDMLKAAEIIRSLDSLHGKPPAGDLNLKDEL